MNTMIRNIIVFTVALAITAITLAAGPSIQIRMKSGSTWRGEVGDYVELKLRERGLEVEFAGRIVKASELWISVEGEVLGELRKRTVFKSDILSIRTSTAQPKGAEAESKPRKTRIKAASQGVEAKKEPRTTDLSTTTNSPGVFVLPLKGTVGESFRNEEIKAIGEEADKYGNGQIIVFVIESGGGSVAEMEEIHDTMVNLRRRHRIVAWIKEAISAACATAIHCDEIYFMTEGTAGAMTMWSGGGVSIKGEELEQWLRVGGEWAEVGGHSTYLIRAMISSSQMCSYDKDPQTGEVRFYNDLSGDNVLSDAEHNLTLNATNAVHCGFADGVADTEAELAELLQLPEWNEISDHGRKIAETWNDTVERAKREIPLLIARMNYKNTGSGDRVVIIGTQISLLKEAINWHNRCPNVAEQYLPPKKDLELQIRLLRRELARMRRRGG